MATVRVHASFSFLEPQDWNWEVQTATPGEFTIRALDATRLQTFGGSFSYDAFGNVSGTVATTSLWVNELRMYTVTGMNHSASQLQAFAGNPGDTQATYAYVFGGNDILLGSPGSDVLIGYAGADALNGGRGRDTLIGGSSSDVYTIDSPGDRVVETTTMGSNVDAGGHDLVKSSASHALGAYVENLVLTGTAMVDGTGNVLDNMILGNEAANIVSGGRGNDTLNGMEGNDTIVGGLGRELLAGHAGADVFDFNSVAESGIGSETMDRIADFIRGADRIDLSTIDANTLVAGNQAFTLIGKSAFSAPGQVRLRPNLNDGSLVLQVSTDADATPEFAVRLTGMSTLSAADLLL